MILVSILNIIVFLWMPISTTNAEYQPLCIVRIDEDPILKIESINTARWMNMPHSSWSLCHAEDITNHDNNLLSTVTKNALFVTAEVENRENPSSQCKEEITPTVAKSKRHHNVWEVGYEIFDNGKILGEIHDSQSNENIEFDKPKIVIAKHIDRLIRKATPKQYWISVLSVKVKDNSSKQITYEILNPDNLDQNSECLYYSGLSENLFNEHTLELMYTQKKKDQQEKLISEMDPHYPKIKIELLVPKKHLNAVGRQYTACAILNVIPMWTEISETMWSPLNDFILRTTKKLGRLQIIVGTTGTYNPQNAEGELLIRFDHNGESVLMPRLLWRIVKYTLQSPRYNRKWHFAIVIVTHNYATAKKSEKKICESICKENGWPVIKHAEFGMTYCCPANESIFMKLNIEQDENFKVNMFNLEKVQKLKEELKNFGKSFFSP